LMWTFAGKLGTLAESDRRRPDRVDQVTRTYVCSDALNLPFPNETFDRVVCSLVFYLLPLRRAMVELCRVLKPAGMAYIRVPMLAWGRLFDALTLLTQPEKPFIRVSRY